MARVKLRFPVPLLALPLMACEPGPPDRPVAASTEGSMITPKVTLPAGTKVDPRARAALGDKKRAAELLGRSPVPVLAPTSVSLERPTFVVGAEYYALTGRVSGATVAIQGTRAAHRYASIAPIPGDRTLRGTRGFISISEGIRTTAWVESGVAYSVDVECAHPNDSRCTGETFALDVVEGLGLAGGGR